MTPTLNFEVGDLKIARQFLQEAGLEVGPTVEIDNILIIADVIAPSGLRIRIPQLLDVS